MRIYIEGPGYTHGLPRYYRLEAFELFTASLHAEHSGVMGRLSAAQSGLREIMLVADLDEAVASRAVEELLRLTGDSGEGTAILRWDDEHFTRRIL